MKVSLTLNKSFSFKGATVNINALSDTHGNISSANSALEEMRSKKNDIFCKEQKGVANVLAISGDWFMDGNKKGYLTNPEKKNAEFQLDIFNEFIRQIKKISKNSITIFTPGNHEFDGGVALLNSIFSKINASVIISNLDFKNSDAFRENIISEKILKEKIVTVIDDKNPELEHKILFLGVSPVNMPAYSKKLNGVSFLDEVPKPQNNVHKDDYKKTFDYCLERISFFKKENPSGRVVLLAHTGVDFADNLAKTGQIDLAFDGHEHKDSIRIVNGIPIVPLSQNFNKIVNAKMKIDDNGKLISIELGSINPLKNKSKGPLSIFYNKIFRKDIKKQYAINVENSGISILDIKDIRKGNNYLANFVTDSILSELREIDSSIDFFALNASAIRNPLKVSEKPSVTNFDVMNVLAGIKEEDSQIMTTELTGNEISRLILDNFLFNKDFPQKNPLIHYSGLIIDRRGMLKEYQNCLDENSLTKYIFDARTNMPIEAKKIYKMANVEKYFDKSQNMEIKILKEKSKYIGKTVQELFKQHFVSSGGKLYFKCEERII